jgi:NADH:ubiquinone oxidoreductase subunit H
MTDFKVGVAAFVGTVAPATNLFLGGWEPVFQVLALLGQIVVAAITSLYIYSKWRAVRKSQKDDENS